MGLNFTVAPVLVKHGALYFPNSQEAGDQFRDEDIAKWVEGGHFAWRWNDKGQLNEYRSQAFMDFCAQVAGQNLPIMELACGPNLGLLPDIYSLNPNIEATATDACPILIEKWNDFFRANEPSANFNFAAFDALKMPIESGSVDIITSNIAFGSIRYGGVDQLLGIQEAYRVLKPGGRIYAVESEFEDPAIVQRVFDHYGKENWFKNNRLNWAQRFAHCGFTVEQEIFLNRTLWRDWELDEPADALGVQIWGNTKAYVIRKP